MRKININLIIIIMLPIILLTIPINIFAETEVTTIDTKAFGIKINLFDYDALDEANLPNDYIDKQINSLSPLKFAPTQKGYELNGDNRNIGLDTALQGIVKETLNDNRYPVLHNGENLDVLFNLEENEYKRVYSDVNHLFKRDNRGNFIFDSDTDYAYYDISQGNNGNFVLYNPTFNVSENMYGQSSTTPAGFFPFNAYDSTKTNVSPQGSNGYYNHFFGVTISGTFTYPEKGKNGETDMYFNFSGDDDVWVFIDDVLVLDIGGIHSAVKGSINLATGDVTVKKATNLNNEVNTIGTSNNINDIFSRLGKTFDTSSNSSHKFDFFYLERGSTYSNMNIETNIWDIVDEDIPEIVPEQKEPEKQTVKVDNTAATYPLYIYILSIIGILVGVLVLFSVRLQNKQKKQTQQQG